jgi:hypothetical protein
MDELKDEWMDKGQTGWCMNLWTDGLMDEQTDL